jgi:hypothetical protein
MFKTLDVLVAAILFKGCLNTHQYTSVNIHIYSPKYGWYFLQLDDDTSSKFLSTINVAFDRTSRLEKIIINKNERSVFARFDIH